jgi:hypothetical protein
MKVLKATENKKKLLEGTYKNGAILEFIKDLNNNFVVNTNVINDVNFDDIKTDLQQLEQIDFNPKNIDL